MNNKSFISRYGGGDQEFSKLNKGILLSLATISILATTSQANITITRYDDQTQSRQITGGDCSGTTCTVSSSISNAITINGNGGTLTISSSGGTIDGGVTIQNTDTTTVNIDNDGLINANHGIFINNSKNATINNSGSIFGTSGAGIIMNSNSPTIQSLTNNNGIIAGNNKGVFLKNHATIENFTNSGTIIGKNLIGVHLESHSNIKTLNNKGIIVGKKEGIVLNASTIENLNNNNKGIIAGGEKGIYLVNSKIKTLNNSGTINNSETIGEKKEGIYLDSSTIETFTNSGIISGKNDNGVFIDNGSNITILNNSGTIGGKRKGVHLNNWAKIETLNNSGTIGGKNNDGVHLEFHSEIETLNNSGIIIGKNEGVLFEKSSVIKTLNNSGTIIGENTSGVHIDGTIKTLNNNGTIISNGVPNGDSILYGKKGGILVEYEANIDTINNSGLIDTKSMGIGIFLSSGKVGTINNEGTIKYTGNSGNNGGRTYDGSGIFLENYGSPVAVGNINNSGLIDTHDGIEVTLGVHVKTIDNTGTIKAKNDGIAITHNGTSWEDFNTTLENLNSSGTILAGRYGIFIDQSPTIPFAIGKINLSGLIHGGEAGMYIGEGQKLTQDITIKKGTLAGGTAGIINNGTIGNKDKSGGIKLRDGGVITAYANPKSRDNTNHVAILNQGNGIIYGDTELDNKSKLLGSVVNQGNGKLIGDILVKNGSSISGGIVNTGNGVVTGSIKIEGADSSIEGGIVNAGNGKLEGNIEVSGGGKVDSITNTGEGTISGGVSVGAGSSVENITNSGNGTISGSVTNNGNLGSINNSGNISGNIENNNGDVQINNDGKLNGAIQVGANAGNTAISNGSNGNIGGGITNNSNSNISINNQGVVKPDKNGNHITNNGGGSVTVEDWVVSTNNSGKVESVNVGGTNASNTIVDKVTVETNGNLDLGQTINPENLIQNTTNGGSISSGSVQVGTGENANPAIALYKDPITGKYVFAVNAGASIASMMFQTVVDQTLRRSLMIDTLMDQSAYKFRHWNKKSSKNGIEPKENINGFFLPYRSYNKINLSDNAGVSSGHTTGYIVGFNALKGGGIYGVYLGTEKNNFNNANVFDLDTKAYYGGVKFSNILKTGPYYDVVLGTHLKAAVLKNDLTRFIEKGNGGILSSKGKTNSYAYGINTSLAINYYLSDKTAITPVVGLGYEGGHTKAFSMVGDAAFDHERYYSNTLNLIQTKASLKWFQIWNDKISTVVEGGARLNLNDTLDSTVNFNGGKYTGSIDLPRVYSYYNFSFIYSLTKNLDLSLNYNGIVSDNSGHTHTGYLEFNFKY